MQNIQIIIKSQLQYRRRSITTSVSLNQDPFFSTVNRCHFNSNSNSIQIPMLDVPSSYTSLPIPSRRLILFQFFFSFFLFINFFLLAVLPGGLLLPCTVTSAPMYVWIQHCVSSHRGLQREDFQRERREKRKKKTEICKKEKEESITSVIYSPIQRV